MTGSTAATDTLWTEWLSKFDQLGMTIIVSAGNTGYNEETGRPSGYTSDFAPTSFVDDASPVIVVGSTYHDGSLDQASTPPGGDATVSMYAQGRYVWSCLRNTFDDYIYMDGTSFSAPQVVSNLHHPPPLFSFSLTVKAAEADHLCSV